MKVSEVSDLDLKKITYMQNVENLEMAPEMKEKMIQLLIMEYLDFDSNLIALLSANGEIDLACSQIMKN